VIVRSVHEAPMSVANGGNVMEVQVSKDFSVVAQKADD
jgi:hypothetical protein